LILIRSHAKEFGNANIIHNVGEEHPMKWPVWMNINMHQGKLFGPHQPV
jgi:hypothetical protein